jgi:flagellar biosynthesis protein FlhG
MARIIAIASGKGGVGKTACAANLGLALADEGRATILVDLDLGASNLHTVLGIRNRNPGLGTLGPRKGEGIESLIIGTEWPRLFFIPGDSLVPGRANVEWNVKRKIIRELSTLVADFVILDLGAGSSWNVVDYLLAADEKLIVVEPEITSILNAYSLLKTSVFRIASKALPKGEARDALMASAKAESGGGGEDFGSFVRASASRDAGLAEAIAGFRPLIAFNRVDPDSDEGLLRRLQHISRTKLGLELELAATLPRDPELPLSIAARVPLYAFSADSPYRGAIQLLAKYFSGI